MFWEWSYDHFGSWPVDSEGVLKFDGKHFWQRKANGRRKRVKLEDWLAETMLARDPKIFEDKKWKYKKMYFEYVKLTEVSLK